MDFKKLVRGKKLIYTLKRIIFLGVAITMLFSFSACSNKDGILAYSVAYAESYDTANIPFDISIIDGGIEGDLLEKIGSKEELIALSNKKKYPFFDESSRYYDSNLGQKIRGYDDSYFQEKSLVLVYIWFSNYWIPANIESIKIKDKTMHITITRPDQDYIADAITTHFFLIEVDKKDVQGVDEVTKEIIRKGKHSDYTDNRYTQDENN